MSSEQISRQASVKKNERKVRFPFEENKGILKDPSKSDLFTVLLYEPFDEDGLLNDVFLVVDIFILTTQVEDGVFTGWNTGPKMTLK
mmetsp:Transcript_6992/g.13221  ORF Transcript_6992/g.13221 Transcript_6992/m.13221 type:complete len:87 (+) Transcript_6992:89-349(+)